MHGPSIAFDVCERRESSCNVTGERARGMGTDADRFIETG